MQISCHFRIVMMDPETAHIINAQDLRLQSFDGIRFASYRTASKLRYIQRSTNCKSKSNQSNGIVFHCIVYKQTIQCLSGGIASFTISLFVRSAFG